MRRIIIVMLAVLIVSPIVTIGRAKPAESPRPTPTSIPELTHHSYLPAIMRNPPTPTPTPTARPTLAAPK